MVQAGTIALSVISAIALASSFFIMSNSPEETSYQNLQVQHPTNFQTLYQTLIDGYDVSYAGSFKKCYNPLNAEYSGSIISAFQYYNDTRLGKERIQFAFTNLVKNSSSNDFIWSYFRESMFPNQTINIYTSEFSYFYEYEKNNRLTECSFDQVDFKRIQYVKPVELKTFDKIKEALTKGKIVRLRNFLKACEYKGNYTTVPDVVQGAIVQNFKLFAASSGIPEYITFTVSTNFQNVTSVQPQMLSDLNQVRIFQNSSVIINTNIFDATNQRNTEVDWFDCQIHGGIFFYTDDHSILPF